MSRPAIVSNATGVVDSVVDEVTGLIVPVNDAAALSDGIARFVADPDLAQQLGAQARTRVETDFAQGQVWSEYLAVLARQASRTN